MGIYLLSALLFILIGTALSRYELKREKAKRREQLRQRARRAV